MLCASRKQTLIAESSGEAEFYGACAGAAEGIWMNALLEFLGWKLSVALETDAKAAEAMLKRRGTGAVKTLERKTLWVQERVAEKKLEIRRIAGEKNGADIGTKSLKQPRLWDLAASLGLRRVGSSWEIRSLQSAGEEDEPRGS